MPRIISTLQLYDTRVNLRLHLELHASGARVTCGVKISAGFHGSEDVGTITKHQRG